MSRRPKSRIPNYLLFIRVGIDQPVHWSRSVGRRAVQSRFFLKRSTNRHVIHRHPTPHKNKHGMDGYGWIWIMMAHVAHVAHVAHACCIARGAWRISHTRYLVYSTWLYSSTRHQVPGISYSTCQYETARFAEDKKDRTEQKKHSGTADRRTLLFFFFISSHKRFWRADKVVPSAWMVESAPRAYHRHIIYISYIESTPYSIPFLTP